MTTVNADMALLSALEHIDRNVKFSKAADLCDKNLIVGLCDTIALSVIELDKVEGALRPEMILARNVVGYVVDRFRHIAMKSWCDYSGDPFYPVPHPYSDPAGAYQTYNLYEGEYGKNRLELLQFALDYQRAKMGVDP